MEQQENDSLLPNFTFTPQQNALTLLYETTGTSGVISCLKLAAITIAMSVLLNLLVAVVVKWIVASKG